MIAVVRLPGIVRSRRIEQEAPMTLLRQWLCVACLAATAVPYSPAQTLSESEELPSQDTMESWLLSGDPRLVAWGAHDILVSRNQNLTGDLLTLANGWQPLSQQPSGSSPQPELSSEQKDERDAMAAVLDALIQMNVAVPADTLRRLSPDFGNDVVILLARLPAEESGALSFELYRSPPEHGYALQYVSAALLAQHPPPGFAADLLANIHVRANVWVVLPGSEGFGVGGGGSHCVSPELPREDWPAIGQYALSKQKGDGASLVVGGVDPIYATRKESTRFLGDDSVMSMGVYLGPGERLRLISEMLGVSPGALKWQTAPQTTIEFASLPQFDAALRAFVDEQQEKYRATADALVARDLMAPEEADESLPELELNLIDMRGEGAVPIPKTPDLPSRLEWFSPGTP
jgi:hypothetical protein